MGCPACGAENPPGNRFCGGCGARLALTCPGCGAGNPPTNRFCGECGAGLAGESGSSAPAPPTAPPSPQSYTPKHLAEKILAARSTLEGERKQVTVLFADVVGSTELIRDLDPEAAQRLLDGAVQRMMEAVHRFEGTVSRAMGDGIMALFGAPIAHEDHAVRACYAALAMQETVRRYAEDARRQHGQEVEIRVGLNSGEVIVRLISDDLHMDYTALGQSVHLAARMEQLARASTTRLTAATLELVEGYVQVRSLGPVPVKGLDAPLDAYELVEAGAVRTRLQAAAARGLTRFVGRQSELEAIHGALERARGGRGQVAALVGEPGVGKSRLVWEVTHSHRVEGWAILESGSVSYGKATSYLPVIDLLKAYCRIEVHDDARAIREKLIGKLLNLDESLRPLLPALLSLLDVPAEDAAWDALDPGQRRRQTHDAVKRLLLRESQEQPLLVVFEDLHWIDAETQAVLDSLLDSIPTSRILLLVNFRPEYTHTWGNRGYYTQLRIDPLGQESAEELLTALLGDDPSIKALYPLLIGRTDGNPFFLEESVRTLVEQRALVGERGAYRLVHDPAALRVPPTVQAILAARIDRLPAEQKRLLQTATVVGKDVPLPLLAEIAELPDDDLQRGLGQLRAAEFLYEVSLFPEPEYTFKHALTHEVAYGSLLQDRRKTLHGRIADAVERLHAARLDEQTELLAHHALRGERWEQAVSYCQAAGRKASARSAYGAAIERFEQALQALGHLPESRENLERRFDLQLGLRGAHGASIMHERAFAAAQEALATATQLGDPLRIGQALLAPTTQLIQAGRFAEAQDALTHALAIAQESGDVMLASLTRQNLGQASLVSGRFKQGVEPLIANLSILTPDLPFDVFERFGTNTYAPAISRAFLTGVLAHLGEFDKAVETGDEMVRIVESVNHQHTTTVGYLWVGYAHLLRGASKAIEILERGYAVSQAIDHPVRRAYPVLLALAYARMGRLDEAAQYLDPIVAGARPGVIEGQALVGRFNAAQAAILLNRSTVALELVRPVLDRARELGAPGHEAYALFALAEVGRHSDLLDGSATEQAYRESLALAIEWEMRPLQARCHLGLGTLLRTLGRREEAQSELSLAVEMLREMGMTYWLPEAESELAACT